MSTPTTPQPVEVRSTVPPIGDDRWSRWAATGAEHDRNMHRRTVMIAGIVGASLAVWAVMALVVR